MYVLLLVLEHWNSLNRDAATEDKLTPVGFSHTLPKQSYEDCPSFFPASAVSLSRKKH